MSYGGKERQVLRFSLVCYLTLKKNTLDPFQLISGFKKKSEFLKGIASDYLFKPLPRAGNRLFTKILSAGVSPTGLSLEHSAFTDASAQYLGYNPLILGLHP